uniref:Uncharacterized protein n=1 Tax=Arundo donax TaxID=35708 RepID=A0A0A9C5T8_ARUDO
MPLPPSLVMLMPCRPGCSSMGKRKPSKQQPARPALLAAYG